jgi:lipid A disaccharide synthetase
MDSFEEKPPLVKLIGDLPENLIHKIIKCLIECQPDDLSQYFEELLSKEVMETKIKKSIEQLKSKWNKGEFKLQVHHLMLARTLHGVTGS